MSSTNANAVSGPTPGCVASRWAAGYLPARFHSHAHLVSLFFQTPIELLCFQAMFQSLLLKLSCVGIYPRNLLEARVVVTTLYLVCVCPIRSLCVSGELDRVSAGGRSHPEALLFCSLDYR
jgi:hypothetical protein